MRECCKQTQAEVVSKTRNKIHQTWEQLFSPSLYLHAISVALVCTPINELAAAIAIFAHRTALILQHAPSSALLFLLCVIKFGTR